MSNSIKPSKRSATSWDVDFKPKVADLKEYLIRLTGMSKAGNRDIFMLCLGVGFKMQKTRPRPPKNSDAVILKYFTDADRALMRSVALSHSKDHSVLLDEDRVYDIAEEYAAGGLEVLVTEMSNQEDFVDYLTKLFYVNLKSVVTN